MRTLITAILLLFLVRAAGAMVLEGEVRLEAGWEPVLHLSIIEDIGQLNTASYQFLIAQIRLDSTGYFHVEINGLPETDHLYRLHVRREGDPVPTIMIGGRNENFIHFIGHASAHITVMQPPGDNAFSRLQVKGVPASDSFKQLLDWRRNLRGMAGIPSEQNEMRLRREIERRFTRMADTSTNMLVRFCALEFLEEIAEQPPVGLYRNVGEDLPESDSSPYAVEFRERMAFLDFQAREDGSAGNQLGFIVAGGLLIGTLILAGAYVRRRRRKPGGEDDSAPGFDLAQLSSQELRVWELLRQRKSNKEIAAELNVEVTTVKSHVYRIYNKLGIKSRREVWGQDSTSLPAS